MPSYYCANYNTFFHKASKVAGGSDQTIELEQLELTAWVWIKLRLIGRYFSENLILRESYHSDWFKKYKLKSNHSNWLNYFHVN